MISAREARQNASNAIKNAYETRIFKHAIKNLEKSIKEATSRGEHEICFNTCYFDIRPFSSLQKDEHATAADHEAIKSFMEKNGYVFFYHSVMNIAGRFNSCFTCRW